jgi:PAS domain S-box-containing protein
MTKNKKSVNDRLAENELKYNSIFMYSFDAILLTEPDGSILAANPAACAMFGRTEEEICRVGRSGIMNTDDPRLSEALSERELTGHFSGELSGIRKDGTIFPVELSTSVFTDNEGLKRTSMIIRDISRRIKFRQLLESKEANMRAIIENTDGSIWSIDKNLRLIECNSAFRLRFHKGTGRLIEPGDMVLDFVPGKIRDEWSEYFRRGLSGEKFTIITMTIRSLDKMHFRYSFNPIRDKSGSITGLTVSGHNITDLVNAQEELWKSEERFKHVAESAGEWIWEVDNSGMYIYASPQSNSLLGYSPEEIIGKKFFFDFFAPEVRDDLKKAALQTFRQKKVFRKFENVNIHKDGHKVILETSGFPIIDHQGKLKGYRGADVDITKSQLLYQKLVESEVRLKEAQSVAKIGNWEYDVKTDRPIWSNEMFKIFALPKESGEPSWQEHRNRIHPDDWAMVDKAVELAAVEGVPYNLVFRIVIPGEEIKWANTICRVEKDNNGKVHRLYGTVQDITARKISEGKLERTELLLRNVLSNAPITIFAADQDGIFTLSEGKELENAGLKPGENVGVSAYDLYRSLPFKEPSGNYITGETVIDRALSGETMLLTSELNGAYFYNHIGPITEENGRITGIVGVATNITENIKAEHEIAKSQERLRNLFEMSVVPIWEEDFSEVKNYFDGLRKRGVRNFRNYFTKHPEEAARCASLIRITDINQTSVEFFGAANKSDISNDLNSFFTDESFRCFTEELISLAEGRTEYECDIPIRTGGNRTKYVHLKLQVQPGHYDTLSQVLVSWIDISYRLNYEAELRKSEEALRQLNIHIEEARENERSLIALNLHDDLGQKLTALKMDISWLRKRMGVQSEMVIAKFDKLEQLINNSVSVVQKISSDLRPGILYDLGLKEAVDWYLKQNLEPAGIETSFKMIPARLAVDEQKSIVLFRIIQEALTNIIRHSGASMADLRITASASHINLVIKDNGRGIDPQEADSPSSFGIVSMKERVKAISGQVRITGIKDKGTVINVKIPVN